MNNELKAQVDYLGIRNKVYFTGQLSYKDLCKMYTVNIEKRLRKRFDKNIA